MTLGQYLEAYREGNSELRTLYTSIGDALASEKAGEDSGNERYPPHLSLEVMDAQVCVCVRVIAIYVRDS